MIELEFQDNSAEVFQELLHLAGAVVAKTAIGVEADTKGLMTQGNPPPYKNSSKPGDPPAVRTGDLKNSIQANQVDELNWDVNVGDDAGIFLELGTVKMAPRPFLTPAVEGRRAKFVSAMQRIFE